MKKYTLRKEHVTTVVTTVNIIVFIAVNIYLPGDKKKEFILNE